MRYLSARYVFPISSPPIKNGILCVNDDGCIVDVINTGGKSESCSKLEFYDGILVPGIVNAHCHLELSHLYGIMEPNIGLPGFISSIGKLRSATDETIQAAAKAADGEMRKNGMVAVGDISNNSCTLPIKRDSLIWYRTFVEVFGLDNNHSEKLFASAQQIEQEYRNAGMPVSIVPHALYSVSRTLWKNLSDWYALDDPEVVSIHHHESSDELKVLWEGKGELVDKFRENGLFTEPVFGFANPIKKKCLLVHNTFSTRDDLSKYITHPQRFYFVLCPGSNLFIQNRLPDFLLFSSQKLCNYVCLGTDSLASNTSLSLLNEMKIIQHYTPEIPLGILLQWATLNGARALAFDHLLGSFEINKKPGVNLIMGIDFENMRLTDESVVKVIVDN